MRRVIGFCNLHVSPDIGELTSSRSLASTSFLGRFAFIDFTLSNFSNSGIDEIGVLCKHHIRSLNKHLGFHNSWNLNTKIGKNVIMQNEEYYHNPRYNNDLNNIRANDWFLLASSADLVVIAPVHFLCAIDYSKVIDEHIKSNADITIVYTHMTNAKVDSVGYDKLLFNEDSNKVHHIRQNRGIDDEADISMESYVMSMSTLKRILKESSEQSAVFSLSEFLAYNVKKYDIRGYRYDGFVRIVDSMAKYLEVSTELLSYDARKELFKPEWPIYTVTHDTPPTRYGRKADVSNSFVANGAIINGKVENSVISRGVVIGEGAVIKNSVILGYCVVGNDTILENCIVDKYARVITVKKLNGTSKNPLYVKQGDII